MTLYELTGPLGDVEGEDTREYFGSRTAAKRRRRTAQRQKDIPDAVAFCRRDSYDPRTQSFSVALVGP